MSFISEWTICVCITLVIAVLFSLLSPSGNLSGFHKLIISIFIFTSFFIPFIDGHSNIKFDIKDIEDVIVDENTKVNQNIVDEQVKQTLVDYNIIGATVSSVVSQNENEIMIDYIQVTVPDDYKINDVNKLLFDELGINAKVIHIGD